MEMKMPHGGTQGIGMGLVKRCVSWLEGFTKWEGSQVEALLMLAAILAGVVLL
jgi:hypothetical protein